MKKYDIIVIGSGAGAKIAAPAAKLGYKAAIIEKDKLGGTCLNRGCIPSKMLIHPADVAQEIREAKKFGIKNNPKFEVDFGKLTRRINGITDSDSNNIRKKYESGKIKGLDFYHGTAEFLSDRVILINGEKITAEKIIIGVGARPSVPLIPGLEGTPYMTSTEALRNRVLPKRLVVIGGGYIGCELGHAYGGLGSDVHFLARGPLIAREDAEIREAFTKVFTKKYKVHFETTTKKVSHKDGKFTITFVDMKKKTRTITADALLVATGVRVNTDLLKLEKTSIKLDKRGFVEVNKFLETSVKGVYALGDCAGNYMFRHSANFEAEYLLDQLFHKKKATPIKYPPMPHAIFSNPQVAGVGFTEDELKEKKRDYVVGLNYYKDSAMGMALLENEGFVKLLFDKRTKKLIGTHIIGPEASNMIHMLIVYMTLGAKVDDLLNIIYIHPALPEIVRNAARKAKAQF